MPTTRRGHPENGQHAVSFRFAKAGDLLKTYLLASAAILGATLLATAAVGGTYALLNSSASAGQTVTIQAGSAAVSITSPLVLSDAPLYPGARNVGTVEVRNDGTVSLALRLFGLTPPTAQTALSEDLVIGARTVSAASECTSSLTPTITGTFRSAPVAELGTTLAPGATAMLCVSVVLSADAPSASQSQTATSFGLLIDGRQV